MQATLPAFTVAERRLVLLLSRRSPGILARHVLWINLRGRS